MGVGFGVPSSTGVEPIRYARPRGEGAMVFFAVKKSTVAWRSI